MLANSLTDIWFEVKSVRSSTSAVRAESFSSITDDKKVLLHGEQQKINTSWLVGFVLFLLISWILQVFCTKLSKCESLRRQTGSCSYAPASDFFVFFFPITTTSFVVPRSSRTKRNRSVFIESTSDISICSINSNESSAQRQTTGFMDSVFSIKSLVFLCF